jgi:hypothetical protein
VERLRRPSSPPKEGPRRLCKKCPVGGYIYEHSPILLISTLMMEKICTSELSVTWFSYTGVKDPTKHSTVNIHVTKIILFQNFRRFVNNKIRCYQGMTGTKEQIN